MPPNHFESEVESFLEGSHGDRTHIKRADHHTVTPLCGTLLTNVVNLLPKTLIFSEKAVGLTTFVTTDQKSTGQTPPIDDVCNNTQRSAPRYQHDKPDHIGGSGEPGCSARGRRLGLAGLRADAPSHTPAHQAPLVWRAPEGPEGTGGLRGAAPNEVKTPSLAGGRARRRPEHPWRRNK